MARYHLIIRQTCLDGVSSQIKINCYSMIRQYLKENLAVSVGETTNNVSSSHKKRKIIHKFLNDDDDDDDKNPEGIQ